ncbi:MAG: tRNA guanosine(34) transglycosylase Tgt [Acidobacteriota bacterium]|jgi:queuine tRNA-ribosyltransferase|nr:tRNA guanosine(34) transglycosylase Tgt [Acidobacteriota bacterium]
MLPFSIVGKDPETSARAAELSTPHGVVRTPAFMPVGTAGTVKGMAAWELERLAPQMILGNTYHLLLRPGVERIGRLGGLHRLMGWNGPILTDSGGFQVFSLAGRRTMDADGVTFRSHIDGDQHRLTPENVIETQAALGVDVAMVLDECLPYPVDRERAERSTATSVEWALRGLGRALEIRRGDGGWDGGVFAIQQGSLDSSLRRSSSEALAAADFDGFAIGGLAVGEPADALYEAVAMAAPLLPDHRPRYLMGVGYPEDILHAIECGVDLFDCVLPTRSARTGKVFTSVGDLVIKNARYADDPKPLDESCGCPTCAVYSRAALRHLFVANEVTSVVLLTMHNLWFYLSLMLEAREAIMTGRYTRFRARVENDRGSAREKTAPTEDER